MHEGCTGSSKNGLMMLQKIRMKGFSDQAMPQALTLTCSECDEVLNMTTFEYKCTSCGMVYAVTPCSASSADNVQPAGKNI